MAFYRLVDGAYQQFFPDADGRLWSTVVKGFWFRPEWLTQDPLPNAWALAAVTSPDEARAALNLVSPA
jgi:hypothetical protein